MNCTVCNQHSYAWRGKLYETVFCFSFWFCSSFYILIELQEYIIWILLIFSCTQFSFEHNFPSFYEKKISKWKLKRAIKWCKIENMKLNDWKPTYFKCDSPNILADRTKMNEECSDIWRNFQLRSRCGTRFKLPYWCY